MISEKQFLSALKKICEENKEQHKKASEKTVYNVTALVTTIAQAVICWQLYCSSFNGYAAFIIFCIWNSISSISRLLTLFADKLEVGPFGK